MKKFRILISCALVIAILFSLFLPAASAAEENVFKIVNVGDSTSVGHGLNDFGVYSFGDYITEKDGGYIDRVQYRDLGFLQSASGDSYVSLLAGYFREQMPETDVQLVNLGISGMRAAEFRYLLNPPAPVDGYTADYIENEIIPALSDIYGIEDIHGLYKKEIEAADLITVDAVMNTFTYYFFKRMNAGQEDPIAEDELSELLYDRPVLQSFVRSVRTTLLGIIGENSDAQFAVRLVDSVCYCMASTFIHFDGLIGDIRALNPDARILVGGAYNPFRGLTGYYDRFAFDLGTLFDAVVALMDTYLRNNCPARKEYTFFDVPDEIETVRDYMRQFETVWDIPSDTLARIIDSLFSDNHSMLTTPLCTYIRALAAERGIEIGEYNSIYPRMVVKAFEQVRTDKEAADEMTLLVVEYFEKYMALLLDGLKLRTLDLTAMEYAFSGNSYMELFRIMETPFEEMDSKQQTLAFLIAEKDIRNAAAAHFSVEGCRQKFEAAKAQLEANRKVSLFKSPFAFFRQLLVGIMNTIRLTLQRLFGKPA